MLLELFLTLGALCSVLTVFLNATLVTSLADLWIPVVLWIAYSIAFFLLYALFFIVLSLFVDKSKPQQNPTAFTWVCSWRRLPCISVWRGLRYVPAARKRCLLTAISCWYLITSPITISCPC